MKERFHIMLFWIIFLVLFITPILLQGNNYIVGGDDMKLYYLFPEEYLRNYAFNLISDNSWSGALTGYSSVAYFAPFFAIIWFLKVIFPFVNTQALLYGMNFAFGFYFFYKLLDLFLHEENKTTHCVKIVASIMYLFSPFLNETLYSHQMMHIFLISIAPCVFYFYFKGLRNHSLKNVLLAVLIFSLFSTTYNAMPYFGGYIVCLVPLLLYECIKEPKRFLFYNLLAGITFVGLNFYWLFHYLNSSVSNAGLQTAFSGSTFENENARIARGVSTLFSPLNQIFQTMTSGTYTFKNPIVFLNILFPLTIVGAGVLTKARKDSYYSVFLLCLIVSWFFFSPNFGSWGPDIFVWLTENIPMWGMFRNMFDKFAPSIALFYALSFGISFSLLISYINRKLFRYIICFTFVFLIFSHPPRLLNPYAQDREGLSRISGEFNADYWNLTSYISQMDNESRYMWLPLNVPTYSLIYDENTKTYYSGLSPMRILANKTDFTGKYSFLTQKDIALGDTVFQQIANAEYDKVGTLLKELNVRYIIVDHQEVPAELQSFYYGGEKKQILSMQTEEFKSHILGDKLVKFGGRYSLYEINNRYLNDKFIISSGGLDYKKVNSNEYELTLYNLENHSDLIFLEPFNRKWTLYEVTKGGLIPYKKSQNEVVYDYANKWTIDSNANEQIFHQFVLKFKPVEYTLYANGISIGVLFIVLALILIPQKAYNKLILKIKMSSLQSSNLRLLWSFGGDLIRKYDKKEKK